MAEKPVPPTGTVEMVAAAAEMSQSQPAPRLIYYDERKIMSNKRKRKRLEEHIGEKVGFQFYTIPGVVGILNDVGVERIYIENVENGKDEDYPVEEVLKIDWEVTSTRTEDLRVRDEERDR
jgi:hypothetical protein